LSSLLEVRLKTICDSSEKIRDGTGPQYAHGQVESDFDAVLAVHHIETERKALEAGNVYVKRPIALGYDHAPQLTEIAEDKLSC
jgi:hypothetical protein